MVRRKSVAEIATERNLTVATIEAHLVPFISSGEIDINDLVTDKKRKLILDAVAIHGSLSHKTLIESLPGDISYGDVRMVLAAENIKAE